MVPSWFPSGHKTVRGPLPCPGRCRPGVPGSRGQTTDRRRDESPTRVCGSSPLPTTGRGGGRFSSTHRTRAATSGTTLTSWSLLGSAWSFTRAPTLDWMSKNHSGMFSSGAARDLELVPLQQDGVAGRSPPGAGTSATRPSRSGPVPPRWQHDSPPDRAPRRRVTVRSCGPDSGLRTSGTSAWTKYGAPAARSADFALGHFLRDVFRFRGAGSSGAPARSERSGRTGRRCRSRPGVLPRACPERTATGRTPPRVAPRMADAGPGDRPTGPGLHDCAADHNAPAGTVMSTVCRSFVPGQVTQLFATATNGVPTDG